MISDEQILKKLSNPQTVNEGFGMLVSEYSEKLYWQVRRIVLIHEDANDVIQNTYIKAWNNLESFEGKSKLITWLSRIAINEALNYVKSKKREAMVNADEDASIANNLMADDYFDGDETEAQLQEAVARLPEVQRVVFTMKYFEGLKYSEISKILGTSEGALKASYHLAVKKIEEYFKNID